MNVLSLFDGISCGQIALNRAGIPVESYFSSEIDKDAIKVTQDNYSTTIQLGDVRRLEVDKLPAIDILMGGSPCQGFSQAGKQLNFSDDRSKLFFEFVRILEDCKPKYFLLENVKMKQEFQDIISKYLGVVPIPINSALVSAQNRLRLYWTNIPLIRMPTDAGIYLDNIITDISDYLIPKNWHLRVPLTLPKYCDPYNKKEIFNKSTTLRTNVNNGNMWVKVENGYRNLTRNETESLQTIPKDYTKGVSDNKAKKLISNGWTVDVISHLLSPLI